MPTHWGEAVTDGQRQEPPPGAHGYQTPEFCTCAVPRYRSLTLGTCLPQSPQSSFLCSLYNTSSPIGTRRCLRTCHSTVSYHMEKDTCHHLFLPGRNSNHFCRSLASRVSLLPDLFTLASPAFPCPRFTPEPEEMTLKTNSPGSISNLISPSLASGGKAGEERD